MKVPFLLDWTRLFPVVFIWMVVSVLPAFQRSLAEEARPAASSELKRQIQAVNGLIDGKRYEEAEKELDRLLKRHRTISYLHKQKAVLLHTRGKTQEALDYLTALIAEFPNSASFVFSRGEFLYEIGYLESAKQDLFETIKLGSDSSAIFQYLAIIEMKQDNPHLAIRHFESALKTEPENHTVWFNKAKLEYRLMKFADARESCLQAIRLHPEDASYHQLLVVTLYNIDDQDALEKHLKLMLRKFPDDHWASLHLVSLLIRKNENQKAHTLLQTLQKKYPDSVGVLNLMGDILSAGGRHKRAIILYRRILELQPQHTEIKVKLARSYLQLKDMGLAEKYLAQAVEEESKNPFVYEKLAQIYNGYDDTFEAEKVILKGLGFDRKNLALILEYAKILTKRGKLDRAVNAYEQALALEADNYMILGNLGTLYRLTGKIKKAEEAIDKAFLLHPDKPWVRTLRIELLLQKGKTEETLSEIERLIELDAKSSYAFRKKAMILLKSARYEEAYEAVEKAVRLEPSSPSLGVLKGNILARLKQYREAEAAFEQVLAMLPGSASVLTRMAYVQVHTDKARALDSIERSMDGEVFDIVTLELYLYLTGKAADIWEMESDGAEYGVYESIMRQEFESAAKAVEQLKLENSPYAEYFAFLLDLIEGGEEAELNAAEKESDIAWFSFYQTQSPLTEKEPDRAIRLLERALQLRPDLHWVKIKLAILYEESEQYDKAIGLIDAYLAKYPDSYWAKIRLAINYDFSKQPAKAERTYLNILNANKDDALSLNNLAWLYLSTEDERFKKVNEALVMAKRAVVLNASSENLDTLAEAYFQKKEYQKALRAIEYALDRDRGNRDYFKKQKKKIRNAMEKEQ